MALLAPAVMAVEVFMDILQPTYMSQIIDVGVAGGNIPFIWDRGKIMLLVAVIGALGGMGCTVFSSIAAMRFGTNLRQAMFDKIQTLSFRVGRFYGYFYCQPGDVIEYVEEEI